MYAIISDGGRQLKVEEGQEVVVDYRDIPTGEKVTFDRVLAVKAAVDRTRYVPRLAAPAASAKHARALDDYCDLYRRLYRGVAAVTGASVLVDASKHASLAYALRRAAENERQARARAQARRERMLREARAATAVHRAGRHLARWVEYSLAMAAAERVAAEAARAGA